MEKVLFDKDTYRRDASRLHFRKDESHLHFRKDASRLNRKMKTATVTELKKELKHHSQKELIELCLRLSKFKKENKELLSYLLFG